MDLAQLVRWCQDHDLGWVVEDGEIHREIGTGYLHVDDDSWEISTDVFEGRGTWDDLRPVSASDIDPEIQITTSTLRTTWVLVIETPDREIATLLS